MYLVAVRGELHAVADENARRRVAVGPLRVALDGLEEELALHLGVQGGQRILITLLPV
jgi:hypothetical protein